MLQSETGFRLLKGHLDRAAQAALVEAVLARVDRSPLFTPVSYTHLTLPTILRV